MPKKMSIKIERTGQKVIKPEVKIQHTLVRTHRQHKINKSITLTVTFKTFDADSEKLFVGKHVRPRNMIENIDFNELFKLFQWLL